MSQFNSKFRKDEDTSKRVTRRKFEDAAQLSITSLLDVLTIILVFLIKNVSMDAQSNVIPKNMSYPSTITNQELIKNGLTVLVRMYPNEVQVGTDNLHVGSLKQIEEDAATRQRLFDYMKKQAASVAERNKRNNTNLEPVLLIQADKQIICQYITTVIKVGAGASFSNVYFSTLKDEGWLQRAAQQMR